MLSIETFLKLVGLGSCAWARDWLFTRFPSTKALVLTQTHAARDVLEACGARELRLGA